MSRPMREIFFFSTGRSINLIFSQIYKTRCNAWINLIVYCNVFINLGVGLTKVENIKFFLETLLVQNKNNSV